MRQSARVSHASDRSGIDETGWGMGASREAHDGGSSRGARTTSTAGASERKVPARGELLRGWAGAAAGYAIGSYGSGAVLNAALRANREDLVLEWVWLPWVLGAVLCGVGAGLGVPAARRRARWTWAAAAAPIPVVAFFLLLWSLPATIDISLVEVAGDGVIQVLVAVAVATGVGLLRSAQARSDET